ncbi:hypothetical protein Cenrod_0085 [Candidatus Symbiobacter mobilis CR]|uniref:Uncharacterized protein n=1 Tax=Candidatus Symbiobacter mobilis CR TaxID=946483 RepID=U5N4N1_9BURK|nr:hypothetical protein Cenrod_0085 [Candidatus Symbiobacter mobilis CR]
MLFSPFALVTSAVSALFFVVDVLRLHLLSRGCFGLGAVHALRGVCAFSALRPNRVRQRLLTVAPHTTHRAGPQSAVQQVGSLDKVFRFISM